jgi:hypothetical protein
MIKVLLVPIRPETAKESPSFRGRDFSPVNNVPFHGALGLKSKLQKLRKESSFAVSGRLGTRQIISPLKQVMKMYETVYLKPMQKPFHLVHVVKAVLEHN